MSDIKYEWVFNNLYNKKVLKAVIIKKNIKNINNNQFNKTNLKTSPVINWMIECGVDCEQHYKLTNDNKLTVIHSGTNRIVSSTIFKINEEEKKDCYYLGLQLDLSNIPNPTKLKNSQLVGALNATMFFISPYYLGSDVYSYCAAPGGLGSCMDTTQNPNNVLPNSYGQCPEIDLMETVGRDIIQFTGHNASIIPKIKFIINDDDINKKKLNNIESSYFGSSRTFEANIKNLAYDANIQKLFDDYKKSPNNLKAILNRKDESTYHILPIDSTTSKGKGSLDYLENIQFIFKNRRYRFPYFNLRNNFVNRNSCDFKGTIDAKLYIGDKNNANITYQDASGKKITLVDFKPFDSSGNTIFKPINTSDPLIPNTTGKTYNISEVKLVNIQGGVTCNNFNCPGSNVTYYLQLDNGPYDTQITNNMDSNNVFENLNCLSITITDIDYFDKTLPDYMKTVPPFDNDLIQQYGPQSGKDPNTIKSIIANRPCYGRDSFCSTAMFTAKATTGKNCNVTKIKTPDGLVDKINGDPHAGFVFIGYKDKQTTRSLDTTKPFNLYIHFNFKDSKILFNYRQKQDSFIFNHTIDVTQNLTDQGVYGSGNGIQLNQPWRYSTKITMSYFKKYFESGCNLVVGYNDNYLGPKGYFGDSNFACAKFNNNLGLNPEFSVKIIDTNFDISTKVDVNNSAKCLAFTNSGSRATKCSKCKEAVVNS